MRKAALVLMVVAIWATILGGAIGSPAKWDRQFRPFSSLATAQRLFGHSSSCL